MEGVSYVFSRPVRGFGETHFKIPSSHRFTAPCVLCDHKDVISLILSGLYRSLSTRRPLLCPHICCPQESSTRLSRGAGKQMSAVALQSERRGITCLWFLCLLWPVADSLMAYCLASRQPYLSDRTHELGEGGGSCSN